MENDAKENATEDLFLQYNFTIIQIVKIFVWYIVVTVSTYFSLFEKINHDYGILCL